MTGRRERAVVGMQLGAALVAELAGLALTVTVLSSPGGQQPTTTDPLERAGHVAGWVTIALLGYLLVVTGIQVLALGLNGIAPGRPVAGRLAAAATRLGPRAVAGVAAAVLLSGATACRPTDPAPAARDGQPVPVALEAVAPEPVWLLGEVTPTVDGTVSMVLESEPSEPVTMELEAEPAVPTDPAAPAGEARTVVVGRGDNLWEIARREVSNRLGRPATATETDPYWRMLVEINRPRLVDPTVPDLIYPGQVLQLP